MTVLGFHGTAALLPQLIEMWKLSATQAGWVIGMLSLSALVATPAIALTDRIDARRLMIVGALANVCGYAGFGLFADGFASALFFRGLMGVGFALTYMPGIKALSDRIGSENQARATSTYVSSFSICSSLSVAIAGLVAAPFGWRWAYAVPAVSNTVAALMLALLLTPIANRPRVANAPALFDFRPIIANRTAMGFVFGGVAHSTELMCLRGWTVAFLGFALSLHPGTMNGWNLSLVATGLILLGVPAGMYGGAIATRVGTARFCVLVLLLSALNAFIVGFAASWPFWLFFLGPLVLHNILVMADAGAMSAGAMASADPQRRGATVAFYTMCTSVGSFCGPVLFGAVLDAAGGRRVLDAWGFAFVSIGVVSLLCAVALQRLALSPAAGSPRLSKTG